MKFPPNENYCVPICWDLGSTRLYTVSISLQLGQEKEELEPWLIKEMNQLLTDVWLSGNEEIFDQIFHLIMSENVTGMWSDCFV